ncbi:MAG: nitrogenase molybdenum-iron protein subunit beta [Spirochaetes bacterium]|jgi:nitrogenase molybdenum-iron protein beta chain|nr:nitrogenase molybdenum-iron protein subunit beta [Spirochaetota bacterium]
MLLRHTKKEVADRKALTINPAKTCQPIGAMYAALGINGCMPHSHGSQGCCAYHRSSLTRHYKEPVMAGSSSFTEGASVFGGQANLVQAINNIFTIYDPEIIAVHSTCLSETIGDDLPQIVANAEVSGKVPKGKKVIYASTPSYVGSHITGFANMVQGIVKGFAQPGIKSNDLINIIPGWVEPSDMAEIKRILSLMKVPSIMFPDTSGVMNAPQTGKHEFYPQGGTTSKDLSRIGSASHTCALGKWASESAATLLSKMAQVPFTICDIPIGLKATDRFLMELAKVSGHEISQELEFERGQVADIITDMHQYLYGKKVALWGDPDQLIPLTEFLVDLDMKPIHIVSGTPGKAFEKRIKEICATKDITPNVKSGAQADMYLMHQWILNEPVDLLIGNTYGKYISRDMDIPFVRHGFPIYDRIGHSYFPTVGYKGSMRLLEMMLSAIMNKMDREAPEERFELVM